MTNVTYGRTAAKVGQFFTVKCSSVTLLLTLQGTVLCDGDKPKDAFAPSQDCYDDNVNTELLGTLRVECRGRYDCVTTVPTLPLTSECDGKRREIRVQYSCGQYKALLGGSNLLKLFCVAVSCFEWSTYIKATDCVDQALVNNGWSSSFDLTNMSSAEKKTLLVSKLSFYYDGEIHSEFALANRKDSSDVGSLCGLAAVYQAAVDTTFTVFQVCFIKYLI